FLQSFDCGARPFPQTPPRGRTSASIATTTQATPRCLSCANPFLSQATGSALFLVEIPIPGQANASFFVRKDLVLHCYSRGQLQVNCAMNLEIGRASCRERG